jgi:hypothetical protein
LHSSTDPVEFAAKPEPVTVTLWPLVRSEFGVTAIVGLADAADDRNMAVPSAATSNTARTTGARSSHLLLRRISTIPRGV